MLFIVSGYGTHSRKWDPIPSIVPSPKPYRWLRMRYFRSGGRQIAEGRESLIQDLPSARLPIHFSVPGREGVSCGVQLDNNWAARWVDNP